MARLNGAKASVPSNKGVLWMAVTNDKYELPIAVALSQRELGEIMGVADSTISSAYRKYNRRGTERMRYLVYKVRIGKKEFQKIINLEALDD